MPKKESFHFIFNLFFNLFIKRNDSLLEKYLKVKLIIKGMIPFYVTNNLKNKLLQPKDQLVHRFSSIKSLFGCSEVSVSKRRRDFENKNKDVFGLEKWIHEKRRNVLSRVKIAQ